MERSEHPPHHDHDEQFTQFMNECAHRLFRVGFLLTGDRGQAEELTQSALVRTYVAWRRIRDDDPYSYARRVLVNLHNDWWRGMLRRERLVSQVPDRPGTVDPARVVAEQESLVRALRRLTRRERTVVVYRYYLDLTEQQTANELGVAVGTVKSATARALGKLRVAQDLNPSYPTAGTFLEGAS